MTHLVAFDEDDLCVLSAVLSGAECLMRDFHFSPTTHTFACVGQRVPHRQDADVVGFGLHVREVFAAQHIGFSKRHSDDRLTAVELIGMQYINALPHSFNAETVEEFDPEACERRAHSLPHGQGYVHLLFDEARQILLHVSALDVHMRDLNFKTTSEPSQ